MISAMKNVLNIDPTVLIETVPNAWVFWKDEFGKYAGCNQIMLNTLKISSDKEIIGINDYSLPVQRQEAESYRSEDRMVMKSGLPLQFCDTATVGENKYQLSVVKLPLITENRVVGVLGISYDMNDRSIRLGNGCKSYQSAATSALVRLTNKEDIISTYLLRGKTAKEIALLMSLSPRTVEHHIERIKIKFNVRTRSQLIDLLHQVFTIP